MKPQNEGMTHSVVSVWEDMVEKGLEDYRVKTANETITPRRIFKAGAKFAEQNAQHLPKVKALIEKLESMLEPLDDWDIKHVSVKDLDEGIREKITEALKALSEEKAE